MAKKKSKTGKPKINKPKFAKSKKATKKKATMKTQSINMYKSKVLFEGHDGKFYDDADCQIEAESLHRHLLQGWKIEKTHNGDGTHPKLIRQHNLNRPDTSGDEPLGISMF